ncbi:uncharacterized protein LOC127723767 [Mytilus californianus]|uniref:uncharacterized protein LOC127723767 n=1 Tax=Mytilus californianus TaxID=6549 RepID=UPI0022451811|nr:uncharacterized protein LOC127723767 [Mytilus californianus]XP_052086476.1 uncharacterized protein LOC127723767 [Mytilus californianus]XP_052086477.1 uncharacterized protein LOC127723767 [Mytilus californianus]
MEQNYKDLLYQNYGRNPFVEKKGNKYMFEFRGEEFCIALDHSQTGTPYVYGRGHQNLYDEVTGILGKQYERLQSGKLQIPGTEIDENNCTKQLVKKNEFDKCFANPYAYGRDCSKWPNNTILLYKYSSNATTKYWDIPEDTWKRIDNENGKHAEDKMIEDLENIQEYLTIQPDDYEGSNKAIHSVEVILSYSPCAECSWELCQIKEKMDKKVKQSNEKVEQSKTRNKGSDTFLEQFSALNLTTEIEKVEKIKFKITFSNFYKHLRTCGNQNMQGLKKLLKNDIKLDIFSDDNWDYFFNAAGLVTERPWRQRRERDDKIILNYLESSSAAEVTESHLTKNGLI